MPTARTAGPGRAPARSSAGSGGGTQGTSRERVVVGARPARAYRWDVVVEGEPVAGVVEALGEGQTCVGLRGIDRRQVLGSGRTLEFHVGADPPSRDDSPGHQSVLHLRL